jgi:hypothetical protein
LEAHDGFLASVEDEHEGAGALGIGLHKLRLHSGSSSNVAPTAGNVPVSLAAKMDPAVGLIGAAVIGVWAYALSAIPAACCSI